MDFVRDNPAEPVPEETFTDSHLSWLSEYHYINPISTEFQLTDLTLGNIFLFSIIVIYCAG